MATDSRYNGPRQWWEIIKLIPVAGMRIVAIAAAVNLTVGLLPLGFLIGTSIMVHHIPGRQAPVPVA